MHPKIITRSPRYEIAFIWPQCIEIKRLTDKKTVFLQGNDARELEDFFETFDNFDDKTDLELDNYFPDQRN